MRVLTKSQFLRDKETWLNKIKIGAIVMHPTDTVYGLGCDATNKAAVALLRSAKQQDERPFSVIAPSKQWVEENCAIPEFAREWLAKLPGPYTLVLPLKNMQSVAPNVHQNKSTLGIRIPAHWFSEVIAEFGKPLVTTSVNFTGQPFATSVWNVPFKLKEHLFFAIDDGEKKGPPSTIVDCTGTEAVII